MSEGSSRLVSGKTGESLIVADMGLDFRSYFGQKKGDSKPLTNLAEFKVYELVKSFEVTAGVLFHCLRQSWKSESVEGTLEWLNVYQQFQVEHLRLKPGDEVASSSLEYLSTVELSSRNREYVIKELCNHFDLQFFPKTSEPTWDRIRKANAQAAFCNIHTSGRRCDAKYCNQIHLRNINEETNHRFFFYKSLVELLQADETTEEDIIYRLKDVIFFARHGNECTVKCNGFNIAFFDTTFTYGRLNHAFRQEMRECHNPMCTSEKCFGVHIRKRSGAGPRDRREVLLQNPQAVSATIQRDATKIFHLVLARQNRPDRLAPKASENAMENSRSSSTHSSITSTVNRYNEEHQLDEDDLRAVPFFT